MMTMTAVSIKFDLRRLQKTPCAFVLMAVASGASGHDLEKMGHRDRKADTNVMTDGNAIAVLVSTKIGRAHV